jgi:hypothetical protein
MIKDSLKSFVATLIRSGLEEGRIEDGVSPPNARFYMNKYWRRDLADVEFFKTKWAKELCDIVGVNIEDVMKKAKKGGIIHVEKGQGSTVTNGRRIKKEPRTNKGRV